MAVVSRRGSRRSNASLCRYTERSKLETDSRAALVNGFWIDRSIQSDHLSPCLPTLGSSSIDPIPTIVCRFLSSFLSSLDQSESTAADRIVNWSWIDKWIDGSALITKTVGEVKVKIESSSYLLQSVSVLHRSFAVAEVSWPKWRNSRGFCVMLHVTRSPNRYICDVARNPR